MSNTWDFITFCLDSDTRESTCKMILQAINVTIVYHQFDLNQFKFNEIDKDELKNDENLYLEYSISIFLNAFLGQLTKKVSKYWKTF